MAKFIVEIPDEFIREHADANFIDKIKASDGNSALRGMMEFITYTGLEKELDKGNTEFTMSSKDFVSEAELKIWDNLTSALSIATFSALTSNSKKEQTKEEGE